MGADHSESLKALSKNAEDPSAFQAHSYLFLAYVQLKEFDKAFEVVEQALEWRSSILLLTMSDPQAKALFSDPRYPEYRNKLYGAPPHSSEERKKNELLDDASAEEFKAQLLSYVEEEAPYLNPSISLRALAEILEMNANQLSWVLNSKLGKNFNEFINGYRIEKFKELALDPSNKHISIIGLAYESGFNSKTVFNTTFKKLVGTIPKSFLDQN
jgi:adenylate cyclase